jgi:tetratricopeptide (TPR) repeat protein
VERAVKGVEQRAQRWVARHERALIATWLGASVLLVGALALWGIAFNGAERAVDALDSAWIDEVERAAAELERGEVERATERLEHVVRTNGVSFVKHKHDREHERALALLAEAYTAAERKAKTLATLERLVAFDPRNFANHFRQAAALQAFGEDALAREAYERVLALHPTHWPSVAARIDMEFAAGNYTPVPELYERYLNAWLLAPLRLVAGEREAPLEVQANGLAQEVDVAFELESGWKGALRLETRGFSAVVETLELTPALRVGELGRRPSTVLAAGDVTASDVRSAVDFGELELPHGAQRVRLKLTVFKRLSPDTWTQVQKSYANKLLHERLATARARSRVGGCDEAGTIFED